MIYQKKCLKTVLTKGFKYLFPNTKCAATPLQPDTTPVYLLYSYFTTIYFNLPTKLT